MRLSEKETRPVRIWGRVRVCLRPFRFITFWKVTDTFVLDNHPTEHAHLSVAAAALVIFHHRPLNLTARCSVLDYLAYDSAAGTPF